MDLARTYQKLHDLDETERIGFAYYREFGEPIGYFQLLYMTMRVKGPTAEPDFSCLKSGDFCWNSRSLKQNTGPELSERLFIAPGRNVELNNVQRYVDIYAHQHDFFEIVCTVSGRCTHSVGSETIAMYAGDIVIIPPGVQHHVTAYPDSIAVNIKIRKGTFDQTFISILKNKTPLSDYFARTLYSQNYENSLTFHCGEDAFLFELLLCMYAQEEEKKPYASNVIDGLVSTFFSYLIQNYEATMELSSAQTADNERMVEVENYIRQNYADLTLERTASHFYLSAPYLSTLIKKQTGYSFSEILRETRMRNSRDLLLRANMKVEAVCAAVGYKDTTQFIRTFRQFYGMTPKQYQRESNQKQR